MLQLEYPKTRAGFIFEFRDKNAPQGSIFSVKRSLQAQKQILHRIGPQTAHSKSLHALVTRFDHFNVLEIDSKHELL